MNVCMYRSTPINNSMSLHYVTPKPRDSAATCCRFWTEACHSTISKPKPKPKPT